jgi:DNA repair exonuclease SbcCD ATPase subunit
MDLQEEWQSREPRMRTKEWIFQLKATLALMARSAAQAQRNYDQYLTAMEHIAAMYKDLGALLNITDAPSFPVNANIPGLQELKAKTACMHSAVHKWEHSQPVKAVRDHLHTQTDVLRSRCSLATKAFDTCVEYENLRNNLAATVAKRNSMQRKKKPEAADLEKEVDKLRQRSRKMTDSMQRDVEVLAAKASASLRDLTAQFFKATYKNAAYLEKHFHPDRIGEAGDSVMSVTGRDNSDVVTGVLGRSLSPRSEVSSVAESGVYGLNRNHPQRQAVHPVFGAPTNSTQNSGIPLRYDTDAVALAPSR